MREMFEHCSELQPIAMARSGAIPREICAKNAHNHFLFMHDIKTLVPWRCSPRGDGQAVQT